MEKYSRPTAFLSALFLVIFTCLALTLTHPANAAEYTVVNLNDLGAGSLRQAILDANASPGVVDTIKVTTTGTVTLASDLPMITDDVTINGNNLVVDGAGANRIFSVDSGSVVISDLEVKNGLAGGADGGLFVNNGADVTVSNVTFTNNTAQGGNGGNGIAVGFPVATGGAGGAGPSGGGGAGGTGVDPVQGADGGAGGFGGGGGGGEGRGAGGGGNGGSGGFGGGGYGSGAAGSGGAAGVGGGAGAGDVLGQSGGGGGGAGLGGAVFVATGGTLTVLNGGLPINTVSAGIPGVLGVGGSAGTTSGNALYLMTGTIGTFTVGSGTQTVSGEISGLGGVAKTGAGTLVLSHANNYTGGTTINGGTLRLEDNSALGTGTITVLGSTIDYLDGVTETNPIDFQADATLNMSAGSAEQSGQITETGGSFGIEKTGAGTLTLTGTNSYTGGTTFSAGTLSVGADNNLGDASGNLIFNGGTLQTTADFVSDRSVTLNAVGGTLDTSGNDLSLSGIISGTGGLTKQGTGTLTLSGTNTYSGGTTVSAGTLQGNTTSLQGDITNNASVVFDQTADGTYAGVMSGTGTLGKQGSALLTLSGNNTFTGATTINAGILMVNGTIAGPVIVNTGGTLGGTGTVGPVTNSGRIEPGNSIGTLTVAGNFIHNAGATYEVELDAAGNSDLIDVTGTATINGGIVDAQAAPGSYPSNTSYTILQAAGGVTGTFDTLTCNLAFLDPSLVYNPNNVLLILTRNTMNYANVAITFNQVAVGTALDNLAPSAAGDMLTVLNNINGLTASQARFAYDQMGGASHAAYTATSFNMADQHCQTVARHMEAFRTGLGIDVPRPPVVGWDLWANGLGVAGDRDGDDVASRYDYNIYGFLVGMDRRFSDHFLAGICGGYARADVDLDILADSGHIKSYLTCLYTSYVKGPWYLDTLFSYATNRYHTLRGITFGNISRIATGDYDGDEYSGYLEGGYTLESGNARIQPMLSLQATHLSRDSFMETGADALNLVAADESFTSMQGSLGMRLFKDYKTEGGAILRPEARARWTHELSGDDHLLNARFAGSTATSFLVKGDRPDRHSVVLGLGLTARVRKDLTFRMDYDASISSDLVIHAATALLVFSW